MKRFTILVLAVLLLLPLNSWAKKPAMGQWGFSYGVMDNQMPRLGERHLGGAHFYLPACRHIAIGPSFYASFGQSQWPEIDKGSVNYDWLMASLDFKLSLLPGKIINPYFLFMVGAYQLKADETYWPVSGLDFLSEMHPSHPVLMNYQGWHAFSGAGFGLEISIDHLVIGARAQVTTFEKIIPARQLKSETDFNFEYLAFLGFHYHL